MALGNKIIASFKEVASHDVRLKRSGTGNVVCSDLQKRQACFQILCSKKVCGGGGGGGGGGGARRHLFSSRKQILIQYLF